MPTGTDALAVERIARGAAALASAAAPVVVTPTLPFGSSGHHLAFGGTMSVGTETYYRLVSDLVESLIISGFKRIFILNGHGGNNEPIQLVARDLALKLPVNIAAASYWVTAWDALVDGKAHELGNLPGHAGAFGPRSCSRCSRTSYGNHVRIAVMLAPAIRVASILPFGSSAMAPGRRSTAIPIAPTAQPRNTAAAFSRSQPRRSQPHCDASTTSPGAAIEDHGHRDDSGQSANRSEARHSGGRGFHAESPFLIVTIRTDEGIHGLGEVHVPRAGAGKTRSPPPTSIRTYLEPVLIGEDPTRIEQLTAKIRTKIAQNPFTKSAIEMALWDILGKVAGLPVYKLIGGAVREFVPTKFSISGQSPEIAAEIAAWAVDQGFTTMKVKVGVEPEGDIARVRAVREAVGPHIRLGVDANGGWSVPQAISTIHTLRDFDIFFVEQPVPPADVSWLADVHAAAGLPVIADESVNVVQDAMAIARARAADILSVYVGKGGGIGPARKIAAVAEGAGLDLHRRQQSRARDRQRGDDPPCDGDSSDRGRALSLRYPRTILLRGRCDRRTAADHGRNRQAIRAAGSGC